MNVEIITKYVRNVLFISSCGDIGHIPSYSGTCFLIKVAQNKYIVTAKHVVENYDINDMVILLDPSSSNIEISHHKIKISHAVLLTDTSIVPDFYQQKMIDDFAIFEVDTEGNDSLFDPYFFEYINPVFPLDNQGHLFIVGFPDCCQEINAETHEGSFEPILLNCCDYRKEIFYGFRVTVAQNEFDTFSGFSGSPLFYQAPDGSLCIIGMVLQSKEDTNFLYGIDIGVIKLFL